MEKGDDAMRKLVKNAKDKADYYLGMKPRFVEYFEEDIDEQVSILAQMQMTAKKYDRQEMKDELDTIMNDYLLNY